jgi:hypothetical protein
LKIFHAFLIRKRIPTKTPKRGRNNRKQNIDPKHSLPLQFSRALRPNIVHPPFLLDAAQRSLMRIGTYLFAYSPYSIWERAVSTRSLSLFQESPE